MHTTTAPALVLESIAAELQKLGQNCTALSGSIIAASGPIPASIICKASELAKENGMVFTGVGCYIGRSEAFDLSMYFA